MLGLSRDVQGLGASCPDPNQPGVLPSGEAACRLVAGDVSAIPPTIAWTGVRAAAIAAGLYLFGERKHVAARALAGAVAVEVVVLAEMWWRTRATGSSSSAT